MKIFSVFFYLMSFCSIVNAQQDNPIFDFHNHITLKNYNIYIKGNTPITFMDSMEENPDKYIKNHLSSGKPHNQNRANFKDYTQSDYTRLNSGNIRMVINSITPVEKPTAGARYKSFFNKIATGLPKYRRDIIGDPKLSSWDEFMAEYKFAVLNDKAPIGNKRYIVARDSLHLSNLLRYTDSIPVILSAEGGHIFLGPYINKKDFIGPFLSQDQADTLLAHIDALHTLPHRVFFVTMEHLQWNKLGGNSKSLDGKKFRGGIIFFSRIGFFKSLYNSHKIGFNKQIASSQDTLVRNHYLNYDVPEGKRITYKHTDIGFKVIDNLLHPKNSRKPIYIDLRHTDLTGRLEYYEYLWNHSDEKIPIIFSHGAVTGHSLKTLSFTGVYPEWDRFDLFTKQEKYFHKIDKGSLEYLPKYFPNIASKIGMVPNPNSNTLSLQEYRDNNKGYGWFYPWSLNLANEEIQWIYESDGLIGVMLDERPIGSYMANYDHGDYSNTKLKIFLEGKKKEKEYIAKFICIAPFIRNIIYIVQHSGTDSIEKWKHITLGSDYDGIIDPVDEFLTSADLTHLKSFLNEETFRLFCEFYEGSDPLLEFNKVFSYIDNYGKSQPISVERAMNCFFWENGLHFTQKYF